MSNIVQAIVQTRRVPGGASAKAVMMLMAASASDDGSGVWTSKTNMAADLQMNRRTVQRLVNDLQDRGLVRQTGQRKCRNGFTVEYQIDLEAVENLPSTRTPESAENARIDGRCQTARGTTSRDPGTTSTGGVRPPVAQDPPTGGVRPPHGGVSDPPNRPRTIHEPVGGGGDARGRARDADPEDETRDGAPEPPPSPSPRETILEAMGHDPSGVTASGRIVGDSGDMLELGRWQRDLGLTLDEIIAVVRDVIATKHDGPPVTFRYFRAAMQRYAAEKSTQIEPITQTQVTTKGVPNAPSTGNDVATTASARREERARQRMQAFIAGARGTA